MLRQALSNRTRLGLAARRWMQAATSRQKRALNPDQLQGGSKPVEPPPTSAPPSSAAPPTPPPGGNGGGLGMAPLAVVGVAGLGGAYYYFNQNGTDEKPKSIESVEEKAENPAPVEKADDSKKEAAPENQGFAGNRVNVINLPAKMKGSLSEVVSGPSHPEKGNRVLNVVSEKKKTKPVEDDSITTKALGNLKVASVEEATKEMLRPQEPVFSPMDFSELDGLSSDQLRARIVQLATELKERTRWEAVRLREFLAIKEKETADKYMEALQKQRLEYEDLLAKRLREQEHELSNQMQQSLKAKEDSIQSVISAALEAQQVEHEVDKKAFEEMMVQEIQSKFDEDYGKRMEEYKSKVAKDLQEKTSMLASLRAKLQELETALEASKVSKEGSSRAHRLSAAALALAEKLETNKGASTELQALKWAAGNEGVIATAVSTIPKAVDKGIPTLPLLQDRFEVVSKKCRQAALVPSGRHGLEGQLAGMLFATAKYAPDANEAAPDDDKNNAEYIVARAQKHVRVGELELAVEELEKLEGQPAFIVADWKKDAINRIAVEKALKAIKMECALLNESCLQE